MMAIGAVPNGDGRTTAATMMAPAEDDDARHKREEVERRAKRKVSLVAYSRDQQLSRKIEALEPNTAHGLFIATCLRV
jgi:hypothetical protein